MTGPDAFAVLGLPRRFDIDQSDIEQAYMARVASAHPDAGGGGDGPGLEALNAAREQILDDERRARLLLELLGGSAGNATLPPAFLAEIMEVREDAERAYEAGDQAAIDRWLAWARDRRSAHREEVAVLFAEADESLDSDRAGAIADVLHRWRYVERMLEQVGQPEHAPDA
ncbi:MAG: iron-sulfur cluster co-chaperone HscB C-terminal domain-containing protein [Planctomycetota bacterium]